METSADLHMVSMNSSDCPSINILKKENAMDAGGKDTVIMELDANSDMNLNRKK